MRKDIEGIVDILIEDVESLDALYTRGEVDTPVRIRIAYQ